jgi:hypothetical protein
MNETSYSITLAQHFGSLPGPDPGSMDSVFHLFATLFFLLCSSSEQHPPSVGGQPLLALFLLSIFLFQLSAQHSSCRLTRIHSFYLLFMGDCIQRRFSGFDVEFMG